ncbi:MAG: hypothetical protein ACTSU5_00610 [Promethearchaeota archaeon]
MEELKSALEAFGRHLKTLEDGDFQGFSESFTPRLQGSLSKELFAKLVAYNEKHSIGLEVFDLDRCRVRADGGVDLVLWNGELFTTVVETPDGWLLDKIYL